MTRWTIDAVLSEDRAVQLAYIYTLPPEDGRRVTTVDLLGAHVMLDIDEDGTVAGIEIIGPAVFVNLADLGHYLKQDAEVLTEEEKNG